MIDQLTFEFDNAKSGQLVRVGASYYPYVGWDQCKTGEYFTPGVLWRAFLSFDTSSIPAHYQIEWVYVRIRRGSDPAGEPETYALKFSIGSFIGAALDGNVGEWDGGDLMVTLDAKPADKTTLDLADDGEDPRSYVNKSGDTDIKIWDASTKGSGDDSWGTVFNADTATRCKLYVGYSVPSGTATGVGTAAGTAVLEVPGTATATGVGTATGTAVLEVPGTATATGVGTATGTAVLEVPGTATATGVGTAAAAGVVSGNIAHWGEPLEGYTGGPQRGAY